MKILVTSLLVLSFAGAGLNADEPHSCMSTLAPPGGIRLVELKGAKWQAGQTLHILFMGGTAAERKLVRDTAVEWTKYANLKFKFYDSQAALKGQKSDIRITFDKKQGSHSALGIHAGYYAQNESTMNFGWNSASTILHEFGHALGLKHEHQNPSAGIPWNKPVVYAHFAKQGWSKQQVDSNVFQSLAENTVNFTQYDKDSIMVYEFPAAWTTNGMSAKRHGILSQVDKAGIAEMYPANNPEISVASVPLPAIEATPTGGFSDRIQGVWDCGDFGTMTLKQNKTKVTGNYTYFLGSVQGQIVQGKFSGTWSQKRNRAKGSFELETSVEQKMSNNPTHLRGKWKDTQATDWSDVPWECKKK